MTVYKKNSKYYCRFQINGERHHYLCSGASSIKEAEQIETAFKYKVQQQQNGIVPTSEIKRYRLKTFKNNFLKYSYLNRKVYKQDKCRVDIIFSFFNENTYADSIKLKEVEEFKEWLLSSGRCKKTVNLYIGIMRIMYNIAIKNGWIACNPFTSDTEFKLEPTKIKYISTEAQDKLFKVMPDYFLPIVITALNTGLRKSNLINLKWQDISFEFGTIEITHNKGNKYIKIPMNIIVINMLKSIQKVDDYVFINPTTGTKWSEGSFTREWIKIRNKAGLSDLKFHSLRHTFCTRLIKEKVPVPIVKELMTHSDIKTTMQYTHIDLLDMVKAVEQINPYTDNTIQN